MRKFLIALSAVAALAGCSTTQTPGSPSVAAMPAPGKPLEVFNAEDKECRQYAAQAPGSSSGSSGGSSVLGTAIGLSIGTLFGGHGGGTAVGLGGSVSSAGASNSGANDAQRSYDTAYLQCMYSKGNQVPGVQQPVAPPPPPPSGR